jgi:hypothetical protein
MESGKKKILVVGDGLVGASFISSIKNDRFIIYLSGYEDETLQESSILNELIPTSLNKSGGLGNLWHSVIDIGLLERKNITHSSLSSKLIGEDVEIQKNQEFVPNKSIRPKSILKGLNFYRRMPVFKLNLVGDMVKVTFLDGSNENFDRVFVCHGALPLNDCLINSGMARSNENVSDHIIAQLEIPVPYKERYRAKFYKKGHKRNYDTSQLKNFSLKVSYRPIFSNLSNNFSHKDKAIYNGSFGKVLFKIIKRFSIDIVKQSFFLRYGINFKSKNWTQFVQFNLKDAHINNNGSLSINSKVLQDALNEIEIYGINVNKDTLMSGIHFYNTYSYISDKIANNQFLEDKLITLIAPCYQYDAEAEHFTFDIMLKAEKIASSL